MANYSAGLQHVAQIDGDAFQEYSMIRVHTDLGTRANTMEKKTIARQPEFWGSAKFLVTFVLQLCRARISETEIIQSITGMFFPNRKYADAVSESLFGVPFTILLADIIKLDREFIQEDHDSDLWDEACESAKMVNATEYITSSIMYDCIEGMIAKAHPIMSEN